ncbi:MAG TPA: adenylosuccinate synthase [Acidobacteriota bacterium]|nr:adenylosuccinate synthase [Acidobacteriota bacterium]
MTNRVVLGMQWGDEGKGKVIDVLSTSADLVARFSGGANAGHTVCIGDTTYALHLLPTGILTPRAHSLIGNGVVCDLVTLFGEIDELVAKGVTVAGRLSISTLTHLVLPHHRLLEARCEEGEVETDKIGTTMRGIGPAYADKIARRGVRAGDLADPDRLRQRVANAVGYWDALSGGYLADNGCTAESTTDELLSYRDRLMPMLVNATRVVHDAIHQGQEILFEGAQGSMLDIDFGTYPYVTSSNTTIGGLVTGLGIAPAAIGQVIGVVKAYTTRVGRGPFPTEVHGAQADNLQKRGNEFGTTTGRRRRCGWLDLVSLKYAIRISGVTHIAVTKLDVLDSLDEIPVCVAYDIDDVRTDEIPYDPTCFEKAKPVYRTFPGWKTSTVGMTDYDDLPAAAKEYLQFVGDTLGVRLLIVSTGPGREETIHCRNDRIAATV